MAAQALRSEEGQQLVLYERGTTRPVRRAHDMPAVADEVARRDKSADRSPLSNRTVSKPCIACRTKEARYGFREADRPSRPRTLCFECFRMEINRRQSIADRLARGWNATQTDLPLAETLHELSLRRRRAQIAARRAIATDAEGVSTQRLHPNAEPGRRTRNQNGAQGTEL